MENKMNVLLGLGLLTFLAAGPLMGMERARKTHDDIESDEEAKERWVNDASYENIECIDLMLFVEVGDLPTDKCASGLVSTLNPTSVSHETESEWFEAATNGDIQKINELIGKVSVNLQDEDGDTALMRAAAEGHDKVVELLLAKGASVYLQDEDGNTPLLWAAVMGHHNVVKLLLDNGAYADLPDADERTPLMWAARKGKDKIVKLLLDNRARVDLEDQYGETALMKAAHFGHIKVVKLLLDHGATVDLYKVQILQARELIRKFQQEVQEEKAKGRLLLALAREYCDDSVFDKNYLPLNLFGHILYEGKLIKDFKHNHDPEKEGKEEVMLPMSKNE